MSDLDRIMLRRIEDKLDSLMILVQELVDERKAGSYTVRADDVPMVTFPLSTLDIFCGDDTAGNPSWDNGTLSGLPEVA